MSGRLYRQVINVNGDRFMWLITCGGNNSIICLSDKLPKCIYVIIRLKLLFVVCSLIRRERANSVIQWWCCRAGDQCEVNINDCLSAPCLNNATCVDYVMAFSCLCPTGYTGTCT